MSGPKVVRIVTREEIEAICRAHIAQVEAAIARVVGALNRHGQLTDDKVAGLEQRRIALVRAFEAERYMDVQKTALGVIDLCNAEIASIEATAIAAAEAARNRGRRLADAARSVIALRERNQLPIGAELRSAVRDAPNAGPETLDKIQRELDEALKEVVQKTASTELSKEAKDLAARLSAGQTLTTLDAWISQNPLPVDLKLQRLDKVLAELKVTGDQGLFDTFTARAAAIADEATPDRRDLLTDSLILDASTSVARLKEVAALRLHVEAVAGELTAYPGVTQEVVERVRTAQSITEPSALRDLLTEAQAAVERVKSDVAAKARRQAVLQGLATLGYEVREGMATAWAKDGRIVVRKPGDTDYGVELGAANDVSRLQVRLVGSDRPAAPRDKTRDRDREVIWCSDFDRLKSAVSADGGEIIIEQALGVGVQSVKTVSFAIPGPILIEDPGEVGNTKTRSL
jgi:hypothetical protein